MARKGGRGGKSKTPAGCAGAYRPYSTALKLEQLRRDHEHVRNINGHGNEESMDKAQQGSSQKRMELRSRPAQKSPPVPKKTSQRFKLDALEELNESPEQGKRGGIQRSSTAGNGRRVSAGPSQAAGNSNSRSNDAHSKRRRIINTDDSGGDVALDAENDTDMVAPLSQAPRATTGTSESTSSSPRKHITKQSAHPEDSEAQSSRKRLKYSSPHVRKSNNPIQSTPQSSSRLSLAEEPSKETNARIRTDHLDRFPVLGDYGSAQMERDNTSLPSGLVQGENLRNLSQERQLQLPSRNDARLESLLTCIRSDILREVKEAQKVQAAQLRGLDAKLSDSIHSIRAQVQELSSVLQSRTAPLGSTLSAGTSKTPLAEWEQKLDEMTPFKKEVFSASVFARVLGYNIPLCVSQICADLRVMSERNDTSRTIVDFASDSLGTLLFSLKPNDSRDKNAEGVGKLHSEFKFSVIQNTFYNVQKNTFQQFMVPDARGEEDGSNASQRKGLLTQPVWLKPGFVSPTSILAARSFLENKQQAKRDKVKDTPSRNDIAVHGAVKAYRYLTSHLHDGREKVKSMFFQDVGYLLVDWAGLTTDVDQRDLTLQWEDDNLESSSSDVVYFNLLNVPDTCVARGGENTTEADTKNRDLLNEFYNGTREMVLIAEHDVFVLTGDSSRNKQRKHSGGERRPMRRLIHLIEVAANFCREFTQLPDIWAFLRSHTGSLRCIYAIAIVFRELTIKFLSKAGIQAGRIPSPSDVTVARTSLLQLLPGKGSRASLMASRCVRMVESEYEALNQPDIGNEVRELPTEPDYNVDVGAEIQASASLGVAAL